MKNKSYPLYKVELITDLREMLEVKRRDRSLDFAFVFLRDDIRYVSYGVFADDKYDPPKLEGRSINQTFLPLMLWLIWLPPNAGLPR